jgi:hypothetical protein
VQLADLARELGVFRRGLKRPLHRGFLLVVRGLLRLVLRLELFRFRFKRSKIERFFLQLERDRLFLVVELL